MRRKLSDIIYVRSLVEILSSGAMACRWWNASGEHGACRHRPGGAFTKQLGMKPMNNQISPLTNSLDEILSSGAMPCRRRNASGERGAFRHRPGGAFTK